MGQLIREIDKPYYLPVAKSETGDTYYCMAISPAREIDRDDDGYLKLAVNNQEELLVNNNIWNETAYGTFIVSNDVSQKAEIDLNPLTYATAKIRITIKNGRNVTDLEACSPFAELDRVPTNPGSSWTMDKTGGSGEMKMDNYNLTFGNSIEEQMGNNILYNRMYIQDAVAAKPWYETTTGTDGKSITTKYLSITGETNILPMDARPTPMIIRTDVDVNHTPMQFQYQTNKRFRAGYVYDYTVEISLKDNNIYVASWQDMEWEEELSPIDPTKDTQE